MNQDSAYNFCKCTLGDISDDSRAVKLLSLNYSNMKNYQNSGNTLIMFVCSLHAFTELYIQPVRYMIFWNRERGCISKKNPNPKAKQTNKINYIPQVLARGRSRSWH